MPKSAVAPANRSAATGGRASPKRDHLLRTAWTLFCQQGYHAVGIDTVLAEAGLAKMTLYNHFRSKEDLIVAVLEASAVQAGEQVDAAIAAAGDDPIAGIRAVFGWLEAWLSSPDFSGCAYLKASDEFPAHDARPHLVAVAMKEGLRARLLRLATAAGLRDAETLSRKLMMQMEGAIVLAHLHKRPAYAAEARAAAETLIAAARYPTE